MNDLFWYSVRRGIGGAVLAGLTGAIAAEVVEDISVDGISGEAAAGVLIATLSGLVSCRLNYDAFERDYSKSTWPSILGAVTATGVVGLESANFFNEGGVYAPVTEMLPDAYNWMVG